MERLTDAVVVRVLLLWFVFLAITTNFGFCEGNPNVICKEQEREALLSFKRGLVDPSNRLSSWAGEDCCTWEGVGCDNITGHVVQLILRTPYNCASNYVIFNESMLIGEISNSLLQLKHLHYLDLSCNSFEAHIPMFFGSLTNLRYLNLSAACFSGVIPHQLGNLSNLHHLDISANYGLNVDNIEWISRLSFLEVLDMSGLDLSNASNWLQVMNMLPFLSELCLSNCGLGNINPLPHVNFSSLVVLDLSRNQFISSAFDYFPSLNSLVTLHLSYNFIGGSIPVTLRNISTTMRFLDLDNCQFVSTIPDWLYDITSLERLDLSFNEFHGKLASGIGNLTSLEKLDLSFNGLGGEIPRSLGDLRSLQSLDLSNNSFSGGISGFLGRSSACFVKSLEFLDLGRNQLSGHLPDNLGKCSSLIELDISDNQVDGSISESFGQLSNLKKLDISGNSLEGVVSEVHLANLTRLTLFVASSNLLTLHVSSNWIPPFQLQILRMGSWELGPRFPAWVGTQKDIEGIDLSNARISDVIPTWLSSLPNLYHLNLSHNQMHGNIPSLPHGIIALYLSNNSFNGSLTHFLCGHRKEGISTRFLDLSGNLLSGGLPDCWMNWQGLVRLRLGNNNLSGKIPSSMGSLLRLKSFQLRNNSFFGNLPASLKNITRLSLVDLSENEFSGSIPMWMGENLSLRVLVLRSNKFSGIIPRQLCHLNSLWALDLADNNLAGTIPRCFNNFSAMVEQRDLFAFRPYYFDEHGFEKEIYEAMLVMKGNKYEYSNNLPLVSIIDLSRNNLSGEIPEKLTSLHGLLSLNLSQNNLRGKIPEMIGAMKSLESLDLSMNQLSGVIPKTLANLSFLSYLNLSDNNLSGRIPKSTQIQSFSALSFIGNRELCGLPLKDNCIGDDAPPVPIPNASDEDEEDEGWIDMKWFYMSILLGFVAGFWGVLGPLAFNKAWRYAYFQFFDDMIHKLWGIVCKCK